MKINKIETRKQYREWWNQKLILWKDQQNKLLAELTKGKKRAKMHITKIRNVSGDITADLKEIKKIIREYCEQMYEKIGWPTWNGQFLETQIIKTDPKRNRKHKQTYNK